MTYEKLRDEASASPRFFIRALQLTVGIMQLTISILHLTVILLTEDGILMYN